MAARPKDIPAPQTQEQMAQRAQRDGRAVSTTAGSEQTPLFGGLRPTNLRRPLFRI